MLSGPLARLAKPMLTMPRVAKHVFVILLDISSRRIDRLADLLSPLGESSLVLLEIRNWVWGLVGLP